MPSTCLEPRSARHGCSLRETCGIPLSIPSEMACDIAPSSSARTIPLTPTSYLSSRNPTTPNRKTGSRQFVATGDSLRLTIPSRQPTRPSRLSRNVFGHHRAASHGGSRDGGLYSHSYGLGKYRQALHDICIESFLTGCSSQFTDQSGLYRPIEPECQWTCFGRTSRACISPHGTRRLRHQAPAASAG
jgi:hypothetical protein